jgi:hypothetical protein
VTCSSSATNKLWVPDRMIGFLLLAAYIQPVLITLILIALSLFNTFNNLGSHNNPHRVYVPAVFIFKCSVLEHSLQLSALTACTLQLHSAIRYASLADYRRLLKHFSAALPELHWFPYCQYTLTHTLSPH